ncbi:MAG TPA: thermonuclease family protein [Verrucomicrobiae bacterium]|nr:thermonuclease family protein [Verrucomicrobiae bacterium]
MFSRLSLSALLLAFAVSASADDLQGQASIIDGDTLEIHGERIRLHGLDAPESSQACDLAAKSWPCGRRAALALADLIGDDVVRCAARGKDRYGRTIAACSVRGQDINAWLVREGWAVAYVKYSSDYVDAEAAARAAGRNLWSGPFVMPEEHRRKRQR